MTSTTPTFGFISVLEIESIGFCGGLLVVSQIGRPLEFHCSAPLATNRAQQILYGQTYRSFVCCEQIGLSLLDKCKTTPSILVANTPWLCGLSELTEIPLVVLKGPEPTIDGSQFPSHGSTLEYNDHFKEWEIWHDDRSDETHHPHQRQQKIRTLLDAFTKTLTLDEPFERIEKAIEEAQAIAR